MNATAYVLGIVLQAVAGVIALRQVRRAPYRLPWFLIAISSLLIVVRRTAALDQAVIDGKGLSKSEAITLLISLLFFLGVILMSRMFRQIVAAQETRQKIEVVLRAAGRIAKFGGWNVNLKDRRVIWSDEVAVIHDREPGFSPSVDEGIQFYAPEWRPKITELFEACARDGTPYDEEMELITALGRRIWVRTSGEAVRDSSRRIVGVEGAFQDITEQKEMEQALHEREAMYCSLVESSLEHIFLLSLEGRYLASNGRMGYAGLTSADDLVGRELAEVHEAGTAAFYHRKLARVVQTGRPLEYEHDVPGKDGPRRHLDTLYPLFRKGRVWAVGGICRDITERRRLEEQLRQSQKMEAIGQLAGGIAHDFRNQLQVIMGFGEMLLRRGLVKGEGQAMMSLILKAAESSSKTTGQLLAFSRQETLRPHVQSIRDCMADLGNMLPQMLGEDIRLVIHLSNEDDRVNIDSHLFLQAILNLAANSRDAMSEGGALIIETARVTLGAESRKVDLDLAEGPYVVVSISDTGSGMDHETLSRVFDPFFTTKDVGKGSGLGLAMVYGFVKQSGGAVAIQSEPGQGTTVRLYFPHAVPVPVGGAATRGAAVPPCGSETILMVEDEPAVLSMMSSLLRDAGYHVQEAQDAEAALSLVERYDITIDMLVTDIVMPGKSGVALAGELKARYPGLSVLYISGYPGVELAKRGIDESAEILTKPFSGEYLLGRVRQVLDGAKI